MGSRSQPDPLRGRRERACELLRRLEDAIWAAIEKKRLVSGREKVVLALDATDCPIYSFRSVVAEFKDRFGAEVTAVGYKAIWMVGPSASLVQRLDSAP